MFKGQVAFVTGAASGIGRATALSFAAEGARVAIVDVAAHAKEGAEIVAQIEAIGSSARFISCDVSRELDVANALRAALDAFGKIDFAFNNAGIEGDTAETHSYSVETWDRVISVNLRGAWLCMRGEIDNMLLRGNGVIVNCSSGAGLAGSRNHSAYSASKHGLIGLTRSAAIEYGSRGLRVNAVCPAAIATSMVDRWVGDDEVSRSALVSAIPMARTGSAQEVADAVIWLCSPKASFVNGHAVCVDGGWAA